MPKLRKPPPFPFGPTTEAQRDHPHPYRHSRVEQIKRWQESIPSASGTTHGFQRSDGFDMEDDVACSDTTDADRTIINSKEDSVSTGSGKQSEEGGENDEVCTDERKGTAGRARDRLSGLDLDVVDGLAMPPAHKHLPIRLLNAKRDIPSPPDSQRSTLQPPERPGCLFDLRVLIIPAAYVLLLLAVFPAQSLQLVLLIMMFFARFPAWMPWWTALIALVLPMDVRRKLEVVMFLGLVVWVGGLDWGFMRERVGRCFPRGVTN